MRYKLFAVLIKGNSLYNLFPSFGGFPGGAVVESLPAIARDTRDMSLIPELGRTPGIGNGNPLQCSFLGNPVDRGAWWATVPGVTEELDVTEHAQHPPVS